MQRKGFTLIELLVVIAIIAILAAILFPVFSKAREKARQAACLSNSKQIAIGIMMYTEDWDGAFPKYNPNPWYDPRWPDASWSIWMFQVVPYINNTAVFTCPSANPLQKWSGGAIADNEPGANGVLAPDGTSCYGINTAIGPYSVDPPQQGFGPGFGINETEIVAPADLICTGDSRIFGSPDAALGTEYLMSSYTIGVRDFTWPDFRHSGGANFTFCDGHSKWLNAMDAMSTANRGKYWYCDGVDHGFGLYLNDTAAGGFACNSTAY